MLQCTIASAAGAEAVKTGRTRAFCLAGSATVWPRLRRGRPLKRIAVAQSARYVSAPLRDWIDDNEKKDRRTMNRLRRILITLGLLTAALFAALPAQAQQPA